MQVLKYMKNWEVVLAYEVAGSLSLWWFGYLYTFRTILCKRWFQYKRDLGRAIVHLATTSFWVELSQIGLWSFFVQVRPLVIELGHDSRHFSILDVACHFWISYEIHSPNLVPFIFRALPSSAWPTEGRLWLCLNFIIRLGDLAFVFTQLSRPVPSTKLVQF